MPRGQHSARYAATQGYYTAARQLEEGATVFSVRTELRQRFGLTAAQAAREVNIARQMLSAGDRFKKLGRGSKFPVGSVPVVSGLSAAYVITGTAWCSSAATGQQHTYTVRLQFTAAPTKADINAAALAQIGRIQSPTVPGGAGREAQLCDPGFGGMLEVETVARR